MKTSNGIIIVYLAFALLALIVLNVSAKAAEIIMSVVIILTGIGCIWFGVSNIYKALCY